MAGLLATTTAPAVAAEPFSTIGHAEALILNLAGILPRLTDRDRSNVSHVLDRMADAATSLAARLLVSPVCQRPIHSLTLGMVHGDDRIGGQGDEAGEIEDHRHRA